MEKLQAVGTIPEGKGNHQYKQTNVHEVGRQQMNPVAKRDGQLQSQTSLPSSAAALKIIRQDKNIKLAAGGNIS